MGWVVDGAEGHGSPRRVADVLREIRQQRRDLAANLRFLRSMREIPRGSLTEMPGWNRRRGDRRKVNQLPPGMVDRRSGKDRRQLSHYAPL